MAWSAHARAGRGQRLAGCSHTKRTSCLRYALRRWRTSILPAVTAAPRPLPAGAHARAGYLPGPR
jgi:hypothetical protein